jgi:MoaA/NifB/PqqE/SkfB family radical SAM enzyme
MMLNSLTYLTRKCPQKCSYCRLRDANIGPELSAEQWVKAFGILKDLGIDFNLVLGNETWLLRENLVVIFSKNKVPYALYTTCPPRIFNVWRDIMFGTGMIDNLSCGVDYPFTYLYKALMADAASPFKNDMELKSFNAWNGLLWTKENYPKVDTQGTMTISRINYEMLEQTVGELSLAGVFSGLNFIHYDKDGGFDFFPAKEEIESMLFEKKHLPLLREIMDKILFSREDYLVQNIAMLAEDVEALTDMGWHCKGNPYGGPTIDADGRLRCCGYRAGKRTPQFTIFDLPQRWDDWKEAVYQDAMECCGCFWSYPWMYHTLQDSDSVKVKDVFVKHAGKHIDPTKWSDRKIKE